MKASDLSTLQDLSLVAATVRDHAGLLGLLAQQWQAAFGFQAVVVAVSQGQHHHRYLAGPNWPQTGVPNPRLSEEQPNDGSLYSWLLYQPAARQLPLAELEAVAPADPGLQQLRAAELVEVFGAPLRIGGRPIGVVALHYRADKLPVVQLPLFRVAADLLAVAVDNVLANEQVEQLHRQLLAPDPAVALLRTRAYLAQTVVDTFRRVLPFEASCLVAYDQDLTYEWFYLGDLPPAIAQDEAVRNYFPQLRPKPELTTYASRAKWLTEPTLKIFSRAELEHVGERGYPILRAALREGVQESLFMHLRVGDQPVGSLILYSFQAGYFAAQQPLFPHLEQIPSQCTW